MLDRIGADTSYNVGVTLRLTGALDATALCSAIDEIVSRHEVLRTRFTIVDAQVAQVVMPVRAGWTEYCDLMPLGEDVEAVLAERLDSLYARRFDLILDDLFVTRLYRVSETEHVLACNAHHIVLDGTTVGLMLDELRASIGRTSGTNRPRCLRSRCSSPITASGSVAVPTSRTRALRTGGGSWKASRPGSICRWTASARRSTISPGTRRPSCCPRRRCRFCKRSLSSTPPRCSWC